jgi:hypothetical protein
MFGNRFIPSPKQVSDIQKGKSEMSNSFDPAAIAARELLAHFGKNTAVRVDHKYGRNELCVVVARTGNEIATLDEVNKKSASDLYLFAVMVMGMRKFPKPRNMKRAWSPIRLSEKAKEEMDIRRATMNGYFV